MNINTKKIKETYKILGFAIIITLIIIGILTGCDNSEELGETDEMRILNEKEYFNFISEIESKKSVALSENQKLLLEITESIEGNYELSDSFKTEFDENITELMIISEQVLEYENIPSSFGQLHLYYRKSAEELIEAMKLISTYTDNIDTDLVATSIEHIEKSIGHTEDFHNFIERSINEQ